MIRLSLRLERMLENGHVQLSLYANGSLISGSCGLQLRRGELVGFILHIKPDSIQVDREQIDDDLFRRLAGIENIYFV